MKRIKKYVYLVLGVLICAITFNTFFLPHNILSGGVSSIGQILNYVIDINVPLFILICDIILLILSYILLGEEKTVNSIIGSLLFPFFVYLTEDLVMNLGLYVDNSLLSCVFGGVLYGFGLGIVYKSDSTTGGTDIVNQIVNKYFHVSIGTAELIVNGMILFAGSFIFGFENLMYSLITIYLMSILIDKLMLGISNSKSFYIITTKPKKVENFILKELHHGVTILDGEGAFDNTKRNVLLTVIPTRDYYKLKEGLKKIDEDAFFVVCEAYETGGGI